MSGTETSLLWETYRPAYDELAERALSTKNVSAWLHDWSELEKTSEEQVATLNRTKDEDTRGKVAEAAYTTFIREVFPEAERKGQRLKERLLALDGYVSDAESTEFVKRFRNEAELFREDNAPLLADEAALSTEYNTFAGGLTVELDGETMTIPEAEKRLLEPDRALRERAWRARSKAKRSVAGDLDDLFSKLLKLRRQIANNAGLDYRAYAWRRWNRFDYTPAESLTFRSSIEQEVAPLVRRLREERQSEMNLPALRPWDLAVDPSARPPLKPFTEVIELENGLERVFNRLDPELAAQFGSLRSGWLELDERFSPGLDWSGLERERAKGWQYFHIFVVPFYMLEYAFAWLGAVQIWQNALHDPQAALKKYREALALGGTKPLPELFEAAGAKFAFDRATVGELMRFVYAQK